MQLPGYVLVKLSIKQKLLLLAGLYIKCSIIKPLNQVTDSIRELAHGKSDLTQKVRVNDEHEIGTLAGHVKQLLGFLLQMMLRIHEPESPGTQQSG